MNDSPPEDEKPRLLREAWQAGIDSGDAGEVGFVRLKQEARARLAVADAETSPPLSDAEVERHFAERFARLLAARSLR
jgi:hypothetical protein